MSGPNQINIDLNVQSNLKDANKDAGQLNNTLKQAAQTAQNINVPRGTAGSRAVAAGAQPVGAQAGMEYTQQRGAAGATGASARDFAAQSQGLGGLVRLYATYAANIFAVSAAFRALSDAMDTTNMISGLNQLGAQSGKALGSLSKGLVAATGGAVSLREAMTATAQASAAGLSGTNILRLGTAATKASQALGVDLSDALSRLSRGITKIEPELLDELGIFVKVDDVVNKYATSVGKTASSITDFEKRQAFANAVLDQAEKKFGAIKIDVNPYTKLAAVAKDTAQSVLELVNLGLTPLVNLLSSSPTALLAVFGAIGVKLTKDAIPALGDYKAALKQTADASRESASKRFQDLKSSLNSEIQLKIKAADDAAEAESERVEAASKRIDAVRAASAGKKIDKRAVEISQKDYGQAGVSSGKGVTEADLKYLDQLAAKGTKISPIYKEMADSFRGYTTAETAMTAAQDLGNIQLNKRASLLTGAGQVELRYHSEINKARSASLVNEAAQIGSTQGLSAALKAAAANFTAAGKATTTTIDILDSANQKTGKTLTIITDGMNGFSRGMIFAKSAAVGLVASIGTAVAAFAPWLEILGLIVAAGALFINWMSTTQEESDATAKSLTAVKDSTKNLADTLEVINKKPLLEQFDPQSVAAKATALNTLGDSLRKVFEDTGKEVAKMSGVDKAVDFVKVFWGGDTESKLVEATSKGLATAFKAIDENSGAGKAASATIKNLLKVDNLESADQISAALKKMTSAEGMSALQEITTLIQSLGKESVISAAKTTELVDSFTKVGEARKKVQNEFIAQDPFSQYGQTLIDSSFKLSTALEDPAQKLNSLIVLGKEIGSLPVSAGTIFDVKALAASASELQSVNTEIFNIDKQIGELQAKKEGITLRTDSALKEVAGLNDEIDKLKQRSSQKIQIQAKLTTEIEQKSEVINKAQLEVFRTGAEIVSNKLSAEFAKAGATINMAVAGVLSGTETGIELRAQAEKSMLASQAKQMEVQKAAIVALEKNSIAVAEDTLSRTSQRLESALVNTKIVDEFPNIIKELKDSALAQTANIAKRKSAVSAAETPGKGGARGAFQTEAGSEKPNKDALQFLQSVSSMEAAIANIGAQMKAIDITTKDAQLQVQYAERKKTLEDKLKIVQAQKSLTDASKETNSETNIAALLNKQNLETTVSALAYDAQKLDFESKIQRYKERGVVAAKELEKVKGQQKLFEEARATQLITESLQHNLQIVTAQGKIEEKLRQDRQTAETRSLETRAQILDSQQKLLESQKSSGLLLESDYINQKSSLDVAQARLAFEQSTVGAKQAQENSLAVILQREAQLTEEITKRKQNDAKAGTGPVQDRTAAEIASQAELAKERDRINTTYDTTAQKASSVLITNLAIAEATKQNALYQDQWNKLLQNTQGIAEALATAFDNVGKSLGDVANSMAQAAKSQADNNRQIDLYNDKITQAGEMAAKFYAAGQDAEGDKALKTERDAIKAKDELQKKSQKDEIMGYSRIAGAAKNMFGQKTAAYKVLAATEKAMSIARLAMDAAEIASSFGKMAATVTTTGTSIAAYMAEAGSKGLSAITGAFNLPPPAGFVAGAAMAAIIGGLLGKTFGGGGGSSGPPPVSSKDRQAAQGTAMGYNAAGQKTQVRAGVFGDTDAKSESVAKSLEIVAANSVDGLQYDNKMLRALEKLNDAFDQVAKQLYATAGLTGGSAFGTREGSSSSRGFLGLFGGGSSSTSIVDSGVKLEGTFASLTKAGAGVVSSFETVQRTSTSSGFFGIGAKSSTSVNTQFGDLPAKTVEAIRGAFSAGEELLQEVAKDAGVGYGKVTTVLQNLDVHELVSLRGLKGKELAEALNTTMSAILDDASGQIFNNFKQFQDFGEGMLQTVVRVTDSNKKVNQALENIGGVSTKLDYAVSEGMVKAAGGIDKFLQSVSGYEQNFLSETDRIAIKQKAVTREMTRLGLSSVKTRQQFKGVVDQLVATGQTGTQLFADLMLVSEGFAAVTKSTEETQKALTDAQQTAYDKLSSAVASLKDLSKSLGDAKQSLLLGTESPLSPGDKYQLAKSSFESTLALARGGDLESRKALPQSITAFLSASRIMFASSEEYTKDFSAATAALDDIKTLNDKTIDTAQLALSEAEKANSSLKKIDENTGNVNTNIQNLIAALQTAMSPPAEAAPPAEVIQAAVGVAQPPQQQSAVQAAVQASAPPAPPTEIAPVYELRYRYEDAGGESSAPVAIPYWAAVQTAEEIAQELQNRQYYFDPSPGANSAATGTNYLAKDQLIYAHKGERIMPEADNRQLMQFLDTAGNTGGLYEEICRLNAQVEQLTKVVADGAIMNAQATDRNTQELSDTMQQTTDQAVYAQRLQSRTGIV